MKVTRFVLLYLLLCVVFISSAIAEEAKKADSLNNDALGDAQVALVAKDYKKAVELLTPLAEANNVRAKALLAPLIFRGTGVDKDTNKGIAMIMDAASQGDVDAQKIAVDLNHELASVGDEKAMYNMGYMCLNGWGGEIESGQCLKWLEDAANMGHTNSAKFLAHIYKNGKYGITADQSKAEEWTQKAQQPPQQPK
jgi:TPR repeat protein